MEKNRWHFNAPLSSPPPIVLSRRGEQSGGNREINGVNWLVQAHFSAVRVVKKQIELYLLGHGLFFGSVPNHHVHSPPPEPLRDSLEAALLALKQTESLTFWATALKKQQIQSHKRSSSAFPLRRSLKKTLLPTCLGRTVYVLYGESWAQAVQQHLRQGRDELGGGDQHVHTVGPGSTENRFDGSKSDILNQELKIKQIPIMWHSWWRFDSLTWSWWEPGLWGPESATGQWGPPSLSSAATTPPSWGCPANLHEGNKRE